MGDKTKIGMDVGHKDNNPLNNDPKNLRNEDPSKNRREPRLRETADHRKDYDTFVKMYAQLNKAMDDASEKLKKFPKGQMGMTSDKVKSSPAYKKAKADYEKVSNLTKRFLKGVPKDFMKKNARSRKEEVELDEFTISDLKGMGIKPTPDQMKKLQKINHQNKGNITRADLKKVGIKEEQINEMTSPLPWLNKAVAKIHQMTHPKGYEKLVKRYMDGMKDKKHREHPGKWAFDLAREYKGIEGRDFIRYINKLVDKGKLPKELKAEYQFEQISFKQFVEVLNKNSDQGDYIDDFVKSDAPQFKGKSKEERKKMAIAAYLSKNEDYTHYPAQVKKDNLPVDGWITGDPTQPIEFGGSDTKSILDKANKSVEKERGIKQKPFVESAELNEKIEGLIKKSEESGIDYSILKKVYDRGMGAYKTNPGSVRPNVTSPQQWAMARVNSFIEGGKTRTTADADLWKQHKEEFNEWDEITEKAEYDGKSVDLNNPTKGDIKKYKVYVRNDKGNVVKVEFGDPNMEIKRDDPQKRASFRARHGCDNPGPKWKAKYWSCKFWSSKSVTDLMKG